MIAGTLARLSDPADEQLESWFRDGDLPALYVKRTQTGFDDRPVQQGLAGARIETNREQVYVGRSNKGRVLDSESEPVLTDVSTEWVADVTKSGLIAAESVAGDDRYAFPFDIFAARTSRKIELLEFDVAELYTAWDSDDSLEKVWMRGSSDEDAASIQYHEAAEAGAEPTNGLGFVKSWGGTVERGIIYESGYVTIFSTNSASAFVRFVEEEILPFAYVPEGEESEQSTLDESDADGRADA